MKELKCDDWSEILCITNRKLVQTDFYEQIDRIAQNKPKGIVLREKDLSEEEYFQMADRVKKICDKRRVPLILHTYWRVAVKLEILNVHLPLHTLQEMSMETLKSFKIIGASVHSAQEAVIAQKKGATYVTAGHIFATDCKKGLPPRGLPYLEEVCKAVQIPVYAIGGINTKMQKNLCLQAGAQGVCIMSKAMQWKAVCPLEREKDKCYTHSISMSEQNGRNKVMSEVKYTRVDGGVCAAKGFAAASCEANIKYKDRTDMAMVFSKEPCTCAGTFTTNVVKAACVQWDQKIVASGKPMHAVVVNSGIANACTGQEGFDACEATAAAVEKKLQVSKDSVAVASTGVIGMQLPVEKLVNGVEKMSNNLEETQEAGTAASKAIMTTDTINKEVAVSFEVDGSSVTLGGMSKGSGMIHPNMCTMLGFLTTDLCIEKSLLQEALSEVVQDTFNMITVDGDTSTNDTLLIMANGLAGNTIIKEKNKDYETFKEALFYVCCFLARRMAGDGEGASKLFEAKVVGAKSKEDARTLAKAIVGSNLSKAAIFGCDANFGRFLCAMGYSGAQFDQNDVELYFESENGKLLVFDHGTPIVFDEDMAVKIMKAPEVTVYVDMHEGDANATAWGCDLTYDYVKINADYRS